MREIVLHSLWLSQRHLQTPLQTTLGIPLQLLWVGTPNSGSGPDIHFSRIGIGGQIWCGHVEIHVKASDWYRHGHHLDPAYNTVILHVVWSSDMEVRREDKTVIPTLELSSYLTETQLSVFDTYTRRRELVLPCHSMLGFVPDSLISSWLEELYTVRLEEKSEEVLRWHAESRGDWEAVFFRSMLKGFGLNRNGEAFLSLSKALPYHVVRKLSTDLIALESLLLGLSGLLERRRHTVPYFKELAAVYRYQRSKFRLERDACYQPEFFSLRPWNFPTLRLSQLAHLYHGNTGLFHRVRSCTSLEDLRAVLRTRASSFWETHFTFDKTCDKRSCKTSERFTDLLLLNAVFPVMMAYGKSTGMSVLTRIKKWARGIRAEDNTVIRRFKKEGIPVKTALESQALLQLHKTYCQKNKCLQCPWGDHLLYGKY